MTQTKAYCLIVPHYSESFRAFTNLAKQLYEIDLEPLFLISPQDKQSQDLCQTFQYKSIAYENYDWREQFKNPFAWLKEPLRLQRWAQRIFDSFSIAAVILVDDRRSSELFLIREAQHRNIPSIVLMWAASNPSEIMLQWRQKGEQSTKSAWAFLARYLSPQAIRYVDSKPIYWQHPMAIVSLSLFAKYPANPWILGGGNAKAVAVIGDYYREMLEKEGVPPEKIYVTGHPRHDDWQHLERKIAQDPYILLAAPPLAQIKKGTRAGHVSEAQMNDYLHWVIEQLLSLPYRLIVKAHPRDAEARLPYTEDHSRPLELIRNTEIAPVIAEASLLLCQGSSVVYDAMGIGTPVLSFDFYETPGYDLWNDYVTQVREKENFLSSVQTALSSEGVAAYMKSREVFLSRYVCADGKASQRILNLIETLNES